MIDKSINLSSIGSYSSRVASVFIKDNILASGSFDDTVKLFDISDPSNPVLLSTITDHTDRVFTVDIEGNVLISGSDDTSIILYDISDPSNPVLLSTITDHTHYVWTIFIKDNILASGSFDDTVKLFDISDPSNPVLLSTITDHTAFVWTVFIKDNILATNATDDTLNLYDISDPSNPILLSSTEDVGTENSSSYPPHTIYISKNILAFGTSDGDNSVDLYDISDPANPILLSTITDHTSNINSVFIKDNILASGSDDNTVKLFDISGYQNDFVDIPFAKLPSFTFQGNKFKTDIALSEISVYLNDTHLQSYTTDLFQRKEITIDPATLVDGDNFFLVIAEDVNGNQSRATAVIGKDYFSNTTLEHDTEEYKLIMPQGCMYAEATWGQHAVGYVTDSVRFLFDRKPNNMLPVSCLLYTSPSPRDS